MIQNREGRKYFIKRMKQYLAGEKTIYYCKQGEKDCKEEN